MGVPSRNPDMTTAPPLRSAPANDANFTAKNSTAVQGTSSDTSMTSAPIPLPASLEQLPTEICLSIVRHIVHRTTGPANKRRSLTSFPYVKCLNPAATGLLYQHCTCYKLIPLLRTVLQYPKLAASVKIFRLDQFDSLTASSAPPEGLELFADTIDKPGITNIPIE